MTSNEIQGLTPGTEENRWLREIAYQLAVMNERNAKKDADDAAWYKARGIPLPMRLGSPVGADSDNTVRGGHQDKIEPYCRWCRLIKREWENHPECEANPHGRSPWESRLGARW